MAAVRYKIVDLTKIPSADPARAGKFDMLLTYQDPAGRVRVITFPYEEFEAKPEEEQEKVIMKYIRIEEEERKRFVGREITI